MTTFELKCFDKNGMEQLIHIVAPTEGDAMIAFRDQYSLDDWSVECMHEIIETAVIELP